MSANPHRRGLLALIGAGTAAAATGGARPSALALGRFSSGVAGGATLLRGQAQRFADELDRAVPLAADAPGRLTQLVAALESDPAAAEAWRLVEARAIAALALVYPPEIAAYRSFGAPMRRRLYTVLLARESARLRGPAAPPPTPPASPGPDA